MNQEESSTQVVESLTNMSLVTEEMGVSTGSEPQVYTGDAICQEKLKVLLEQRGFPSSLFPVKDIIEFSCPTDYSGGFFIIRQKNRIERNLEKLDLVLASDTFVKGKISARKIEYIGGVHIKGDSSWTEVGTIDMYPSYIGGGDTIAITTQAKFYPKSGF